MTELDPHALLVADASRDRRVVAATPDDALALALGAAREGTLWFGRTLAGAEVDVARALHVSRYGDALLYADPTDPEVALRIVSGLQSGRIAETLVRRPLPVDDDEPPTSPGALRGPLGIDGAARTVEPPRGSAGADVEAWLQALRHPPGLDDALSRLDALAAGARHFGHEPAGLHRQVVDIADPASLWVLHRGFLRRVQGSLDDVADHRSTPVALAIVRRVAQIDDLRERRFEVAVERATRALRNVLLAAPFVLGWLGGLVWWVALTVGLAAAGGATGIVTCLRRPRLRPWLLVTPVGVVVIGFGTVGVVNLLLLLVLCVAVVLVEAPLLHRVARAGVLGYAGTQDAGLDLVPLAKLVETSGR